MEQESKAVESRPRPVPVVARGREWWPLPLFPLWRTLGELVHDIEGRGLMAIDEYTEDRTLVVRAEMPGLDPDKDVEIVVGDGRLHIKAEHTQTEERSGRHFHCRELRSGSFTRTIALPEGVDASGVNASCKDGILEVRVQLPVETERTEARRVPVTRA